MLPTRSDSDPESLQNIVLDLKRRLEAVEQSYVHANAADELVSEIGNLDYRAVDAQGRLRMIMSAKNLLEELGVSAYLIGMDENGVVQFYVNADDGKLYAAGGKIYMDVTGIVFENGTGILHFKNVAGLSKMRLYAGTDDHIYLENNAAGKSVKLLCTMTDASSAMVNWHEAAGLPNIAQFDVLLATDGSVFTMGGAVEIWAHKDGKETVFNQDSYDIDFRVEGATDANLFKVDAGLDKVLISGYEQGWFVIEDKLLGADGTFDFQSIPATFKHLKIEFDARSDRAGTSSDAAKIKFNNDGGNNYVGLIQWGAGQQEQATAGAPFQFTYVTAATSPANWFNNSEIIIFDYANTNKYKSYQARGMQAITNSAGNYFIYDGMGLWLSTAAISRVTLFPSVGTNFKQHSRATLYGMK